MVNSHSSEKCEEMNKNPPLEYDLRKYLLLLAILVATVTYAAGFNPPGGVWQETEAGHLAGDSIIRDTNYPGILSSSTATRLRSLCPLWLSSSSSSSPSCTRRSTCGSQ
ncbi:hypothetical protein GUJ93_ZPchr0006g42301 [Zizania palustris]|uniref:PGG domain-containing protein n=1 Tax=Zizania palustris TaxID=103762 RepID=A0A8J5TG61_ZIZPA|nr:hypothetical protein GUJ93_ZPchr0006g42301 [Zizania palustris]